MENIQIVKTIVHAAPGALISDSIKDAVKLAMDRWENVELTHNSKLYVVNVNDIVGSVHEKKVTRG